MARRALFLFFLVGLCMATPVKNAHHKRVERETLPSDQFSQIRREFMLPDGTIEEYVCNQCIRTGVKPHGGGQRGFGTFPQPGQVVQVRDPETGRIIRGHLISGSEIGGAGQTAPGQSSEDRRSQGDQWSTERGRQPPAGGQDTRLLNAQEVHPQERAEETGGFIYESETPGDSQRAGEGHAQQGGAAGYGDWERRFEPIQVIQDGQRYFILPVSQQQQNQFGQQDTQTNTQSQAVHGFPPGVRYETAPGAPQASSSQLQGGGAGGEVIGQSAQAPAAVEGRTTSSQHPSHPSGAHSAQSAQGGGLSPSVSGQSASGVPQVQPGQSQFRGYEIQPGQTQRRGQQSDENEIKALGAGAVHYGYDANGNYVGRQGGVVYESYQILPGGQRVRVLNDASRPSRIIHQRPIPVRSEQLERCRRKGHSHPYPYVPHNVLLPQPQPNSNPEYHDPHTERNKRRSIHRRNTPWEKTSGESEKDDSSSRIRRSFLKVKEILDGE